MTDSRLMEIQERLEKATAGPWEIDGRRIVSRRANRATDLVIGEVFGPSRELIAHAPTDIAYLLSQLSTIRRETIGLADRWEGIANDASADVGSPTEVQAANDGYAKGLRTAAEELRSLHDKAQT